MSTAISPLIAAGSRFPVDTAEFPGRIQLHAALEDGEWIGHIARDGERIDLTEVRSVFLRRPRPFPVEWQRRCGM